MRYLDANDLTALPIGIVCFVITTIVFLLLVPKYNKRAKKRYLTANQSPYTDLSTGQQIALGVQRAHGVFYYGVSFIGLYLMCALVFWITPMIIVMHNFTAETVVIKPDSTVMRCKVLTFYNHYGHFESKKSYVVNQSDEKWIGWHDGYGFDRTIKAYSVKEFGPHAVTEVEKVPKMAYTDVDDYRWMERDECIAPASKFEQAMEAANNREQIML